MVAVILQLLICPDLDDASKIVDTLFRLERPEYVALLRDRRTLLAAYQVELIEYPDNDFEGIKWRVLDVKRRPLSQWRRMPEYVTVYEHRLFVGLKFMADEYLHPIRALEAERQFHKAVDRWCLLTGEAIKIGAEMTEMSVRMQEPNPFQNEREPGWTFLLRQDSRSAVVDTRKWPGAPRRRPVPELKPPDWWPAKPPMPKEMVDEEES